MSSVYVRFVCHYFAEDDHVVSLGKICVSSIRIKIVFHQLELELQLINCQLMNVFTLMTYFLYFYDLHRICVYSDDTLSLFLGPV